MIKYIAVLPVAAMLLTSCAENEYDSVQDTQAASSVTEAAADSTAYAEPFTEYTVGITGKTANYMAIIRHGQLENEISVTLENNRYESRQFIITAPDGFLPYFPKIQERAWAAVNIIENDIDSTPVPDIMQFTFISNAPDESSTDVQYVSRMYIVDEFEELRELRIISPAVTEYEDGEEIIISPETVLDYLDRTQLYHAEPDCFIYEIAVDDSSLYDEYGDILPVSSRVRIKTMTFDYENNSLVLGTHPIREDDPLYFGYAWWAAANSAARYFTTQCLDIHDYDHYIERTAANGSTDYYFQVDDSRFESTEELMDYLNTVFSESTAKRIFDRSPYKYTDINGKLYAVIGEGEYDSSLGTLTFSGMDITENRMTFRSRQERFDESGRFEGYTDGGSFAISKDSDNVWRVIQYRYPYSFN